jgi:Sec-independent protein translocase protein TatA
MEGALAPWHLILLLVAFIVLFGPKRLPDAA